MKKRIPILFAVAALLFAGLLMMNWFSKPPANIGVTEGRLAECPSSPNCVCSQSDSESHQMDPIPFDCDGQTAMKRLKAALGSMPRAKTVTETENYLHVEFTTALMRFVDDVELLIDQEAKLIHFRSASRIGHSDLGANRKRMESLREAFEETQSAD